MFVHLSIHYPRPEYEGELIASMHRFGAALAGARGLVAVATLADERSARLVGLTTWASRADWEAAIERARAAVADDEFDLWEERDPEVLVLDEV
jgi:heme-degrading monooxygenase HmoA